MYDIKLHVKENREVSKNVSWSTQVTILCKSPTHSIPAVKLTRTKVSYSKGRLEINNEHKKFSNGNMNSKYFPTLDVRPSELLKHQTDMMTKHVQ